MNTDDELRKALEEEAKLLSNNEEQTLTLKPVVSGLSDDQQNALTALNDWLYTFRSSRDENSFFRLTGSAGTGKTTLLSTFLKELKYPYSKSRVCVCAPTHKAKKVLVQKTKWNNVETLQALLGLKMDVDLENFDVNNPQFNVIGDKKIRDYELVAVDEASMTNEDLYSSITDTAKQYGCKVLFIGDTKQLNPIKEYGISLALSNPIHGYNLTQIVRQEAGNPLIELLDAMRVDIEHNSNTAIDILRSTPVNVNDKGEGFVVITGKAFGDKLKEEFSSDAFKQDKNYCRYIAWTNASIGDTNKYIRQCLDLQNATINEDEILLAYRTITDGDDVVITNSDDYVVISKEESIITDYSYPLQTLFVKLEGIDTGRIVKIHFLVKSTENYNNYKAVFNEELAKAKKTGGRKGWGKFYEFKNEILVLDTIMENNQLIVKKDIDYGYGITIHKSQGSTHQVVFVNGKDINKNPNDIERKKLWYVALSRASKLVYISI